jgi:ATP-dependent DNA helicase PIF1
MELSKEQVIAFDKYIQGHNIFITGPGGSGKSALIKKIYEHAYEKGKNIQVCALTGCASVLLQCKAKTLHSWAGIGLGNGTIEQIVNKIKKNKFTKALWKNTDILVVDEVSMLSSKLFDLLNHIGKAIRGNSKHFGGIQLIFSGDFYQLPPVGNKDEPESQQFCFESAYWNDVFPLSCQLPLVKIFRQTDEVYTTILNQIREGVIKKSTLHLLNSFVGKEYDKSLVVEPTKLFPTKNKVENINNSKMDLLEGEIKEFKLKHRKDLEMTKASRLQRMDYNDKDIQLELEYLAGNLICDKDLKLKVGSQVMCIVNIQNENKHLEICNGSQGIILGFCEITGYPRVKFNNGIEKLMGRHVWESDKIPGIGVSQVPLILAWALTIHKSQGATLDTAEIDIGSGIFECGQTYVALSRVKNLDGLYLSSFDSTKIKIHKKVKKYYEDLKKYVEMEKEKEEKKEQKEKVSSVISETIEITRDVCNNTIAKDNIFSSYNYVENETSITSITSNNTELKEDNYDDGSS